MAFTLTVRLKLSSTVIVSQKTSLALIWLRQSSAVRIVPCSVESTLKGLSETDIKINKNNQKLVYLFFKKGGGTVPSPQRSPVSSHTPKTCIIWDR